MGESSEALYRLGQRLKEYSDAARSNRSSPGVYLKAGVGMSEATRGVCKELDELAALESADARVLI